MTAPVLYAATVTHTRRERIARSFRHRTYYWLVDLDALPALPRWLRPFAQFEARDHLGDPDRPIRENVDRYLDHYEIDLDGGRVLMLAHARLLGHVFNPISVFWCHRRDGTLAAVVAEVHNTHGQRHCYLLRPDPDGRVRTPKEFYVSPFLAVDGEYRMALPEPGERLRLAVALHRNGLPALSAAVTGRRVPATPAALARLLLRHPLVTLSTSALIRRHGIALWLRRLPVIPRPLHTPSQKVAP